MNLVENIRLAVAGLRSNRMRSVLTMLGIIIGIASVIGILTISGGLSSSITDSMSSLGASNITVSLQSRESQSTSGRSGSTPAVTPDEEHLMTDEMIGALRENFQDEISAVSISLSAGSGEAKDGRKYANLSISGANLDYISANNITLLEGRDFYERDIDETRSTAIVSDKLINNLFEGDIAAAIGSEVVVHANNEIYSFTVIGVYEYVQSSMMGMSTAADEDVATTLYIPLTTAKKLVGADDGYQSITVVGSSAADSAALATEVAAYMNQFYTNNTEYQVSTFSMDSMLDSMSSMLDTVSIALAVIAGISLLVGGIGVMNILLVSVTERTREIGTRKAIGATNSSIRVQFVTESIIICLIGGAIGVLLGGALGYFGGMLLGSPSLPTISSIALAAGFSMAIGIFFGYYPANKAAQLNPIEALRYE